MQVKDLIVFDNKDGTIKLGIDGGDGDYIDGVKFKNGCNLITLEGIRNNNILDMTDLFENLSVAAVYSKIVYCEELVGVEANPELLSSCSSFGVNVNTMDVTDIYDKIAIFVLYPRTICVYM